MAGWQCDTAAQRQHRPCPAPAWQALLTWRIWLTDGSSEVAHKCT